MRGSETSGTPQAPGAAHKETHYLKLLMNHLFDLLSLNYALEQRTANSESSECAEQGPVLGDEPSLPMYRIRVRGRLFNLAVPDDAKQSGRASSCADPRAQAPNPSVHLRQAAGSISTRNGILTPSNASKSRLKLLHGTTPSPYQHPNERRSVRNNQVLGEGQCACNPALPVGDPGLGARIKPPSSILARKSSPNFS